MLFLHYHLVQSDNTLDSILLVWWFIGIFSPPNHDMILCSSQLQNCNIISIAFSFAGRYPQFPMCHPFFLICFSFLCSSIPESFFYLLLPIGFLNLSFSYFWRFISCSIWCYYSNRCNCIRLYFIIWKLQWTIIFSIH